MIRERLWKKNLKFFWYRHFQIKFYATSGECLWSYLCHFDETALKKWGNKILRIFIFFLTWCDVINSWNRMSLKQIIKRGWKLLSSLTFRDFNTKHLVSFQLGVFIMEKIGRIILPCLCIMTFFMHFLQVRWN